MPGSQGITLSSVAAARLVVLPVSLIARVRSRRCRRVESSLCFHEFLLLLMARAFPRNSIGKPGVSVAQPQVDLPAPDVPLR